MNKSYWCCLQYISRIWRDHVSPFPLLWSWSRPSHLSLGLLHSLWNWPSCFLPGPFSIDFQYSSRSDPFKFKSDCVIGWLKALQWPLTSNRTKSKGLSMASKVIPAPPFLHLWLCSPHCAPFHSSHKPSSSLLGLCTCPSFSLEHLVWDSSIACSCIQSHFIREVFLKKLLWTYLIYHPAPF